MKSKRIETRVKKIIVLPPEKASSANSANAASAAKAPGRGAEGVPAAEVADEAAKEIAEEEAVAGAEEETAAGAEEEAEGKRPHGGYGRLVRLAHRLGRELAICRAELAAANAELAAAQEELIAARAKSEAIACAPPPEPDYAAIADDERFIEDYAVRSERLMRAAVAEYLRSLRASGAVRVLTSGTGSSPLSPVKRPKSLEEAKALTEALFGK